MTAVETPDGHIPARLTDARVVLMCGISGSGKTVFARSLERCGFVRVSTDEIIWERCGDGFAALPPDERMMIFRQADTWLAGRVESLLDEGCRVVVDATMCRRAKRDAMRSLCSRYGISPLTVYLDATSDVLLSRLASRTGSGPNDQTVNPGQLETYYTNFERPAPDELPRTLVIRQSR